MLSWRDGVQGSGSISKYSNLLKNGQKFRKKYSKIGVIFPVAMILKGLCSWFRVHI
jgi:hypothetical protein